MTMHDSPEYEPMVPPEQLVVQQYIAREDAAHAVEAERRRLAELLNSRVISPLNLLLSQAAVYEQTMGGTPQLAMVVSVLASLARQVLQQTLDLQANLHPTLLEVLGLEAALETLAQQVTRTSGAQILLRLDRLHERLPQPLELALFRAIQDGFDQSIQTARATRIEVRLWLDDGQLTLNLNDNGITSLPRTLLRDTEGRITRSGGKITTGSSTLQISFQLSPPVDLTARELDVMLLLADGLTNKEIAHRLDLSARTINFHLDNIYSKFGVNSRTEAVIYALRSGLVRVNPHTE